MPRGFVALGHREYRRLWLGSAVSNCGLMMNLAAMAWVVELLTDDPVRVTLMLGIGMVPMLVLSPLAGSLADRHPRRTVFLAALAGQFVVSLLWAVVYSTTDISFALLVVFSVVLGSVGTIGNPVQQVIQTELVPPEVLRNAVSLNSIQWNIARAMGPLIGGLLIQVSGPALVFWVNTISYLALIVALRGILARPAPDTGVDATSTFAAIRSGITHLREVRGLRIAMLAGSFLLVSMVPAQWMAVLIARDAFDAEAWQFGILAGALGVGSVVGAAVVLPLEHRFPVSRFVQLGLTLMGLGVLVVAVSPSFWLAVVATGAGGIGFLMTVSNVMTALQSLAADEYRGRIMSLWMTLFGLISPVTVVLLGGVARAFGIRWAVGIASFAALAAAAVMTVLGLFSSLDGDREAG